MVVESRISPMAVGQKFADITRDERTRRGLWVRGHRDYVEVWLLTEPMTADVERHVYDLAIELRQSFPQDRIRFHLLNPSWFGGTESSALSALPEGVEPIPLR